jgi:hypothetical protein
LSNPKCIEPTKKDDPGIFHFLQNNKVCVLGDKTIKLSDDKNNHLYVFLDEGGNFDFSPNGTKYLIFSALSCTRPLGLCCELNKLKFDLAENGHYLEYFHASDDLQYVRDRVFECIEAELAGIRVDSLIAEKAKTHPPLRSVKRFYPKMLGYLLRYVLEKVGSGKEKVIVYTDAIPVKKKRQAVKKATKMELADFLGKDQEYVVLHHESKSNPYLQVIDYVNWAIYRKWDRGDCRSYDIIKAAVRSEFEIFRTGRRYYY